MCEGWQWEREWGRVAAMAAANAENQINQMLVNKSFEFIFIWPKTKCWQNKSTINTPRPANTSHSPSRKYIYIYMYARQEEQESCWLTSDRRMKVPLRRVGCGGCPAKGTLRSWIPWACHEPTKAKMLFSHFQLCSCSSVLTAPVSCFCLYVTSTCG